MARNPQGQIDTRAIEIATRAAEAATLAASAVSDHIKECGEHRREQREVAAKNSEISRDDHRRLTERIEQLAQATQQGFDRMREVVGDKVTEVHNRVNALEKEGKNDAKAEARSANERFWALFWKILALGGVGAGGFFGGKHL